MKREYIKQAGEMSEKSLSAKFEGNRRKIAKKCLHLCEEWAIIKGDKFDSMTKSQAKKDCKSYVKEHLDEEVVGSFILLILTGIVVKLIVDWVVNNFIYNMNAVNKS
jgi:hypothetical protein